MDKEQLLRLKKLVGEVPLPYVKENGKIGLDPSYKSQMEAYALIVQELKTFDEKE